MSLLRAPRRAWTAEEDSLKYQSSFTERTPLAIKVRLADLTRSRSSQELAPNGYAQGGTSAAIPAKRPGEDGPEAAPSQRHSMGPFDQSAESGGNIDTGNAFEDADGSSSARSGLENQVEESPTGEKMYDTDSISDLECFTGCGCTEADSDSDHESKGQAGSDNHADTGSADSSANANGAPAVGATENSNQGASQNSPPVPLDVGKGRSVSAADSSPASALDRLASAAASQQAVSSQPVMAQGMVNPPPVYPAQQSTAVPIMSQTQTQTQSTVQSAPALGPRETAPFYGTPQIPVPNMISNMNSNMTSNMTPASVPGPPGQMQGSRTAAPPRARPRARTAQQPQIPQQPMNYDISNPTVISNLHTVPLSSLSAQQQMLLTPGPHPWLRQLAGVREPIGFRATNTMLTGLLREFEHLKSTYYTDTSNEYQTVSERCGELSHQLRLTKLQLDSTKSGLLNTVSRLEKDITTRNERVYELENEISKMTARLVAASQQRANETAYLADPEKRLLAQEEEIQQLGERLKARDRTIETYERILTRAAEVFNNTVQHNRNPDQNLNQNLNQNVNQNVNQNRNQNPNQNLNQNLNQNVNQNPNQNLNQNGNQNLNQNLNQNPKHNPNQSQDQEQS